MSKKIVIVGSYNVGLFLTGRKIPKVGETLIGDVFHEGGGGKGSNQAIAAALLGADVSFVGRIGTDKYGKDALALYDRMNISTNYITIDDTIHSGISVIFVDADGNNSIMVVPGANDNLSGEDIDNAAELFSGAGFVGFQLENKIDTVLYGIRRAHELGAVTLLDPAPAQKLPDDIYPCIDYIKPNEHEAATLTGINVVDAASAIEAGRWFLAHGVKHAVITLGGNGAVLVDSEGEFVYRAPEMDAPVVDTTGAGDCFSGALLSKMAQGVSVKEAIPFALCAASLSTTRAGVVEALPSIDEANAFYNKKGSALII